MGRVRGLPVRLGSWACAVVLLGAVGPAVAGEQRDPLPTSIAALGDSITRGFNACGFYRDCTRRSWSTGDDGAVHSQRLRLEQRGARLQQWNLARSGARSDALAEQAARAGEVGADYVTIEIGANDVCARSEADMTSLQDFRRNIRAGLSTLRQRVPGAQVYIASIPDLRQLWAIGHTSWYVRRTWAELGVCPSMLARSNSQDPADVGRRDRVRSRTIRFNRILAQECAAYGPMCWFDQLAVFEATFTRDQISRWDYFHPSVEGQQLLAAITWESGFFGADED